MDGSTATVRLDECISHHNKWHGVFAYSGAVVDLMGNGTSVHSNERYGLRAFDRGTINVHQLCVLEQVSHDNKRGNINTCNGSGIIQQKGSNKK